MVYAPFPLIAGGRICRSTRTYASREEPGTDFQALSSDKILPLSSELLGARQKMAEFDQVFRLYPHGTASTGQSCLLLALVAGMGLAGCGEAPAPMTACRVGGAMMSGEKREVVECSEIRFGFLLFSAAPW